MTDELLERYGEPRALEVSFGGGVLGGESYPTQRALMVAVADAVAGLVAGDLGAWGDAGSLAADEGQGIWANDRAMERPFGGLAWVARSEDGPRVGYVVEGLCYEYLDGDWKLVSARAEASGDVEE